MSLTGSTHPIVSRGFRGSHAPPHPSLPAFLNLPGTRKKEFFSHNNVFLIFNRCKVARSTEKPEPRIEAPSWFGYYCANVQCTLIGLQYCCPGLPPTTTTTTTTTSTDQQTTVEITSTTGGEGL